MRQRLFTVIIFLSILTLTIHAGPRKAPGFALPDSSGKMIFLSKTRGNLIISFFASYCTPCRKEIPELIKLEDKYSKTKKIKLLLISTDTNDPGGSTKEKSNRIFKQIGINREFLLDSYQMTIGRYNPKKSVPSTYLINQRGRIVFSAVGFHRDTLEKLENAINTIK